MHHCLDCSHWRAAGEPPQSSRWHRLLDLLRYVSSLFVKLLFKNIYIKQESNTFLKSSSADTTLLIHDHIWHIVCFPMLCSRHSSCSVVLNVQQSPISTPWGEAGLTSNALPTAIHVGEERCLIKQHCLPLTSWASLSASDRAVKDCYPHVVKNIASFHPQAHLYTAVTPKAVCDIHLLNYTKTNNINIVISAA